MKEKNGKERTFLWHYQVGVAYMDGRYRRHLALLVFAITAVVDVSTQANCTVTPINPTTLTTAGGVLPNGTENVMIRCNCSDENGTVITKVIWHDPNGERLFRIGTGSFIAGTPHFIRATGDSNNRNITLVIPTFNDSYDGSYTCGRRRGNNDLQVPTTTVSLTIGTATPEPPTSAAPQPTTSNTSESTMSATRTTTSATPQPTTSSTSESTTPATPQPSSTPGDTMSSGGIPLEITTDPKDIQTSTETRVNFTCEATGDPPISYRWFHNDVEILSTNTTTYIIVVNYNNFGSYHCIAASGGDKVASNSATLTVSPGGSVRITPLDTTTSFESSENLNCLAQGGPNNTFEWTNSQGQVISNSTQLEFPSITGSDGGIYTCTVTNAAGSDNASTTITVAPYNATITTQLTGNDVISTCTAEGGPSTTFEWTQNSDNSRVSTSSMLTLNRTDPENSDTYTCTILNVAGNTSTMITLGVPTPTVRITALNNQTVGQSLTLQCEVTIVRGITSRVDIVWSSGNTVLRRINDTTATTMSNSLVYTDSYSISQLSTSNDTQAIQCEVVINASPSVMASDSITLDVTVPTPTVSVTAPNTQTVGRSLTLQCEVTTVRGITSRVDIVWSSNGTELERTNNVSSVMMGDSLVYTNSYTISQLSTTDEGRVIQCEVVINVSLSVMANDSITLDVTVPTPDVTISPSDPIQGAMVGSPQVINCTVSTVSGVESGSVIISWRGPGNIATSNGRITIGSVTDDGNNMYTRSLQFTYLMDRDEGTYICNVMILETSGSQSVELQSLTIPTPDVTISPSGPIQGAMVGNPQVINCTVSTVSGVEFSSVMISWMGPGGSITTTNGRVSIGSVTDDGNNMYTRSLQFTYLMEGDDGTYTCNVMISGAGRSASTEIQSFVIPTPTVSVTAPNTQTVGQSLTLQCEVTTVRGITSSVDIVWSGGGGGLQRMNNVSSTTMVNSLVYRDTYMIPQLNTSDENRVIQCEGIIQATPSQSSTNNLTLDVTVPQSSVMISQSVDSPNVGDNHIITCIVTVVEGVSSSLVMVNWDRQDLTSPSSIIGMTVNNGLEYTRMITFSPLLSGDRGQYICSASVTGFDEADNSENAMVVVNGLPVVTVMSSSQSVEVTFNVTLNTMVIGVGSNNFTYQWRHNGTIIIGETDDTLIITNVISNDTGMYNCTVMNQYGDSNSSLVSLIVTVTPPLITIHPMDTVIQLYSNFTNHTLTCEANGSSSYMWEKQNRDILSNSTGVNTNTLTLINLQPEDAGNYRCVATNASGSSQSNYANLTINVPPPRIIVHPMSITLPVTANATFVCVGQGYGFVNVSWRSGGLMRGRSVPADLVTTMVTPDNITTITSTLTIPDLRDNNGGRYRCRYSNNGGDTDSKRNRLTIGIPPPDITSHPMNITVNNGSNVTFNCVSFSYANVTYTWLKDGVTLLDNDDDDDVNFNISTDDDEDNNNYTTTLMILDVQLSDDGEYVCNATNREGTVLSYTATLSVIVPPVFIIHPQPNTTNEMGYVTLSCAATSIAPVTFHWQKLINDTWGPLPNTSLVVEDTIISDSYTFTSIIRSINIPQSDEGNYRCIANNSAGTNISDDATITVYGPPTIVFLSNSTTVVEGENVSFVCAANNDLNAIIDVTIRWFNDSGGRLNDSRLTNNDSVTISNTNETGPSTTVMSTLTIDPVIHQNAGQYRCEAFNHPVLTVSDTTQLTVQFTPRVTIVAMNKMNQSEVNVTFNTMFNMSCNVESYPLAVVHWEVDGEQVGNDTVVLVDTSDRGAIITYTCVAVNVINGVNRSANNSIDVIIQDIPDVIPADDITQHERTVTTVVVQWKEPNYYNAPITMYTLNLCQKIQDSCTDYRNYPMNISASEYTNDSIVRYNITGLQPFSSDPYQLSIRAVNDIGSADFSPFVLIRLVNRMEAAAQNLTLTNLSNSEVMATWDVNPDFFELSFFNVSYFIKPEQQEVPLVTVNTTTYQISDLIPGETYTVQVTAYYSETTGSAVFPAVATNETVTLDKIEATPPTVNKLMLPVTDNAPVILSWTRPNLTDNNSEFFQGYNVSFSRTVFVTTLSQRSKRNIPATESQTVTLLPNETSFTYDDRCPYNDSLTLCPYSQYCFSVISVFNFGGTPIDASDPALARMCTNTSEAAPSGPPQEFNYTNIGIREIGIRWNFPQFPNGIINRFTVYYNNSELPVSLCDISTLSCSPTIDNLTPYTIYIIQVSSSTRTGEGPRTNPITVTTSIGRPTAIDNLAPVTSQAISSEAITSLEIDIPMFNHTDGPISHYFIVIINATVRDTPSTALVEIDQLGPHSPSRPYYVAAVLYPDDDYDPDMPFILGNGGNTTRGSTRYENVPITVGTYRYFVRAYTIGPGLFGDSQLTNAFIISRVDDGGSDSNATGPIIGAIAGVAVILLIVLIVLIILAIITRRRGKQASAAKLEESESIEMRKQASPASPAARNTAPIINTATVEVITSVNQPTTLFVETTGNPPAEIEWSKDGSPVNHPIMSDGSLYIMHTEPSDQGEYTVTATNPVGVSQQSITVTVIQPVPLHADPDHKPVKKDDFAQHMALLRSDMEEGFKMEYESLDMAEWEFTQYNAKVTVNKNKNRYINIIPYDHSRVVLNIQDNTAGSDYINASYVNGHNERYVATQGPIPSSYGDFWRMIWENESATIVMLTNLKEDDRVKCHQYWPSYGSAMYGNFQVTLRDVENLAEYSVRSFSVQPIAASADGKNDMREVRQFHFTVWPDHGVPKYGTALLSFQKRIDKYHARKSHGPMVVHCSAGVGRTGTFITIDTQLQKIKQEGILDIFNFVRHLRYCRNYMVQTQAQYVFLHDTVLESLMCGDTSIAAPVKDAKDKVAELAKVNPKTGKTGFEMQFENLCTSSPPEDSFECNVARLPDNMRKNRFPNYLPSDVDRVVLSTDNDQPDYINACFLDGYRHRNAFIGTQGPMIETTGDFWRMIWEHKSYAVIMLTELEENGREMCVQYWPDPGMTLTYGMCIVENISEDHPRQEYIKRNFRIALTSNPSDTRNITQFHFQQWPVKSCPNNPASIIDLLEAMERVQRKTGNGPITVHCNDGIGRTGTFCALAASLERFKTEQMVDVFHTIKTIRIQRAGMVQTLDQYEFIHKTLLEYMTRFELYDNFS